MNTETNKNKWGVGDYIFAIVISIFVVGIIVNIIYSNGYKTGADARDQNLIVKFRSPVSSTSYWVERKDIKDNEVYGIIENN